MMILIIITTIIITAARGTDGSNTDQEYLICNGGSSSSMAKEFQAAVYATYPPPSLDSDCANYDATIAGYIAKQAACAILLQLLITAPAGAACIAEMVKQMQDFQARCDFQRRRRDDALNLVNARIPAADVPFFRAYTDNDRYMDASFIGDPTGVETAAFAALDKDRTLWSRLVLPTQGLSACTGFAGDLTDCMTASWLTLPPPSIQGVSLVVSSDTLLLNQRPLAPDLQLDPSLAQSAFSPGGNLVRTPLPGSRRPGWGFVLRGCSLPNITVRVQWMEGEEPPVGESVDTSQKSVACWTRSLRLMSVGEYPMQCSLDGADTNTLRSRLVAVPDRATVLAGIMKQAWAVSANSRQRQVAFSEAVAQSLLACAQPSSSGSAATGGQWVGFAQGDATPGGVYTPGSSGICTPCSATTAGAMMMRARACNRTLPAERLADCCFGCAPGYTLLIGACVQSCSPGFKPDGLGRCLPCPDGTHSAGVQGDCLPCSGLGYGVNSYAAPAHRGCVACGTTAFASSSTGICTPCPPGLLVPTGTTVCSTCPVARYAPAGATACAACAQGTYLENAGDLTCTLCPTDTMMMGSGGGRAACIPCPIGQRSTPNRTRCAPCDPINQTVFPYLQYYQAGCAVRCAPGVSFLRTNLYSPGGCAPCAGMRPPVGAYMDGASCNVAHPCSNAPARNAHYTNGSAVANRSLCAWACNAGYYLASAAATVCTACAYPPTFDPIRKHRATSGCAYTCLPRLYVDPGLACNQGCVSLLGEVAAGRILHRVSLYTNGTTSRPHYIQGVCGTTESMPPYYTTTPALQRGLYAYIAPAVPPPQACGNAFLDMGEACDDGNAASGDGCSAQCAVETDRYWDCDVIGLPCLPNCGWQQQQTGSAWAIGLQQPNGGGGYVLPACPAGKGCSCAGMTYSEVSLMMPDRAAWMAAHLVPCDCGGNAARMVPYANCTAANRGCRACPAGSYHDDARSVCSPCGSDCAPGFTPSSAPSGCGPLVSTSAIQAAYGSAAQQLAIGCAPCPPLSVAARYVRGCAIACTPGASYCRAAVVNPADGTCPGGQCASCAQALTYLTLSPPPNGLFGYYPQGCADGVGYAWQPCDAAALPVHAHWTGYSRIAGDSRGCAWQCDAGTLAWGGMCLPCLSPSSFPASTTCVSGQVMQPCAGSLDSKGMMTMYACQPCTGALPSGSLQVWASDPPYFARCRADCEAGVSWSPASINSTSPTVECKACTRVECGVGTIRIPCTPRSDAACIACSLVPSSQGGGALPANAEYVSGGSCATRCQARERQKDNSFIHTYVFHRPLLTHTTVRDGRRGTTPAQPRRTTASRASPRPRACRGSTSTTPHARPSASPRPCAAHAPSPSPPTCAGCSSSSPARRGASWATSLSSFGTTTIIIMPPPQEEGAASATPSRNARSARAAPAPPPPPPASSPPCSRASRAPPSRPACCT